MAVGIDVVCRTLMPYDTALALVVSASLPFVAREASVVAVPCGRMELHVVGLPSAAASSAR